MKRVFFLVVFLFSCAFAQNTESELLSETIVSKNIEPNYFGMLLGLFLVIGLVYLTAFVYQKMLKIKLNDNNTKTQAPKIVATTPLGQNKNLHIIKINEEYILVGATQNSITYLKDIDYFEN